MSEHHGRVIEGAAEAERSRIPVGKVDAVVVSGEAAHPKSSSLGHPPALTHLALNARRRREGQKAPSMYRASEGFLENSRETLSAMAARAIAEWSVMFAPSNA